MKTSSRLFSPLRLRGISVKNRVVMSPMCQYSSRDGFVTDWHLPHYGARAAGGAGLIMLEATAVTADGRISPSDLGIWKDDHIEGLRSVAGFIKSQGSVAGIQLAHAGRKASTAAPWDGGKPIMANAGGWQTLGPSPIAFGNYPAPAAMADHDMGLVKEAFVNGARRALAAGFEVIELHMAHGYLLHEFLSPLSNVREDRYGGSFENRIRFPLEVAEAVRGFWPERLPVFVRISATDWADGGWTGDDSERFCVALKAAGMDLVDVSTGGLVADAKIPVGPLFQVPFAAAIRQNVGIATGAVGLITSSSDGEDLLAREQCDLVFMGRQLLRDPFFPLRAAHELGCEVTWPRQYARGKF
jgi:2,4-dienoyl-CoA reductase-like NADH-dependent reductase (Old Yellow Enzyme family)